MTGYLVDDQDFPDMEDVDESSDAEEEIPKLVPIQKQKGKKQVAQEQESSSENENSDQSQGEDGSDDDDEEVEDDSGDEDVDDSEDEVKEPPQKMAKIPNGTANGISKREDKHKESKQKKQQSPQQPTEKNVKVLQGGVKIEDLRIGQGAVAKAGKKVQVIQ